VLQKNPDVYSLWNYRREALGEVLASADGQSTAQAELDLTERCLQAQPKSYGSWYQRRWVVEKGHTDLEAELQLVDKCAASHISDIITIFVPVVLPSHATP
jgi:geranylgeranyl transferase type-2 subunit alpha